MACHVMNWEKSNRRGNVRVPMQVGSRFHFLGLFIERSCPFEDNEGLQSLLDVLLAGFGRLGEVY
jgi:hypothetical protein